MLSVTMSVGAWLLAQRETIVSRLATIQSLIYLKLSVAGQLTIFATRTRGPFWSIAPAKSLLLAVLGAQLVATWIAVFGVFMAPIGWEKAGLVWIYALSWFLLNDRLLGRFHR